MPSKSAKQHRFMEMIAHGGKPRKGKGPSKAVAKEFVDADKGTDYNEGMNSTHKPKKGK